MTDGAPGERVPIVAALRDAGFTALLTFGLLLPLIGFQTYTDFRNEPGRHLALAAAVVDGRRRRRRPAGLRAGRRTVARAPRDATGRGRAIALSRSRRQMVRPLRHRFCHRLSAAGHCHQRLRRRGEMDRQFRHPDSDLRDARLGAQYRRRPRRPARPRLRRLLRGRRLFLCAAGEELRLLVLAAAAARRHSLLVLGHPARLSGAAPARRLPRHRHACLRRNHPPRPHQLGRSDQRLCRHHRHSAPDLLRHSVQRQR